MTRTVRLATVLTGTLLTPVALGLTALPAHAAPIPRTTTTAKITPLPAITVNATEPGALTVSGHRGLPVTVWTKGTKAITKRPTTTKPVTFSGLLSNRAYDVYVGADKAVRVLTAKVAAPASALTVAKGPIDGSLLVTWRIPLPAGTKPEAVSYHLLATSPTAASVELTVHGTDHAILTGLDPSAVYAITVTASAGTKTIGTATEQLTTAVRDVAAEPAPVATTPAILEQPVAKPAVTAAQPPAATSTPTNSGPTNSGPTSSGPTSSGPSTPRTRTIYVCPDGFTDAGDLCQQTRAYTFHDVTTTSPYTYHQEFVKTGSHFESRPTDWSGTVCYGGTMYAEGCGAWVDDGYSVSVKDAPPTGFSDDGSQYSKTESVKDSIPAGYSDDGSQWVKTAAKVAAEVPV